MEADGGMVEPARGGQRGGVPGTRGLTGPQGGGVQRAAGGHFPPYVRSSAFVDGRQVVALAPAEVPVWTSRLVDPPSEQEQQDAEGSDHAIHGSPTPVGRCRAPGGLPRPSSSGGTSLDSRCPGYDHAIQGSSTPTGRGRAPVTCLGQAATEDPRFLHGTRMACRRWQWREGRSNGGVQGGGDVGARCRERWVGEDGMEWIGGSTE